MFSAESIVRRTLIALTLIGCSNAAPNRMTGGGGGTPPGTSGDASVPGGPLPDVAPPPGVDPIEPVWEPDAALARIKSPGQRMHFTAGMPFRILADANDPKAWQCPPGHPPYVCSDSSMAFYVDGALVGTVPPDPSDQNLWELRMPGGLPAGDHVLTVRFTPHAASALDGLVPIYIRVDPVPAKARTVELTSDLVLSGGTDLDWTNTLVKGNGHKVTAAAGYSGKIIIRDSLVTNLAAFDNQIGLDVTTSGGVDIAGSIFEATAPLRLVVNGSAPIAIRNSEFRSTNYVTYVSSDPNRSPILDLAGTTSGSKVMQGNNFGAGIVRITGMANWQIGGLADSQSNIFVGPRCVLHLDSSSNATIQGNYLHHDYYGGFSQGFNLLLGGSSDGVLAEHNVIRDSSWPLQSFGGEFRYNLMVNSGHDFIRASRSGARYHHNILVHAQAPNSGYDGAIYLYGSGQNIAFDNNTLDVGGGIGRYDAPAIALGSSTVSLSSLRNNAFTQFSNSGWSSRALIAGARTESSVGAARVARADYNAWYNPLATQTVPYAPGIASAPGSHDVSADPKFVGQVPQIPYKVDEGPVWLRTYGVSQVLGYYRALYTPGPGSPLVDAGDPGDGAGTDIGAVGAGTAHPADKFGLVMQSN